MPWPRSCHESLKWVLGAPPATHGADFGRNDGCFSLKSLKDLPGFLLFRLSFSPSAGDVLQRRRAQNSLFSGRNSLFSARLQTWGRLRPLALVVAPERFCSWACYCKPGLNISGAFAWRCMLLLSAGRALSQPANAVSKIGLLQLKPQWTVFWGHNGREMCRSFRPMLGPTHRQSQRHFRPIPAVRVQDQQLASSHAEAAPKLGKLSFASLRAH